MTLENTRIVFPQIAIRIVTVYQLMSLKKSLRRLRKRVWINHQTIRQSDRLIRKSDNQTFSIRQSDKWINFIRQSDKWKNFIRQSDNCQTIKHQKTKIVTFSNQKHGLINNDIFHINPLHSYSRLALRSRR